MGWLRALGRRIGIGERRWMPDAAERDSHRRDVRRRLRDDPGGHDEVAVPDAAAEADGSVLTDDAAGPEGGDRTGA